MHYPNWMSVMYGFIRCRQLEGTYPGSPETGNWISTAMRVSKGWGSVAEKDWPYDGNADHWPPIEPSGLDIKAKAHREFSYQRISTVDECRRELARSRPVMVAFEVDDSWYQPKNGIIPKPNNQQIIGNHGIMLSGYDDKTQRFKFQNSWGADWGDSGYGYLPYSYFKKRFLEGWTTTSLLTPSWVSKLDNIGLRTWEIPDVFGDTFHGAEIIDPISDEIYAWGFAIEKPSAFLEIEELFVRPLWRRRGYASELAKHLTQCANSLGKPLRAWIPHSDNNDNNAQALYGILDVLGLSLQDSPVRWAAYIGT